MPRLPPHLMLALLLGVALSAPLPAAEIVSYAIVQPDATLKVRGKIIRLFGIHIPRGGRVCQRNLRPARCFTRAANALETRIQGFVSCDPRVRYRDRSLGAVCHVDGNGILDPPIDLGAYLIERGLAVAGPDAPFDYAVLERIARSNGRGVWGFQADSIR